MAQYNYNCVTEVICNDNNIFPAMKDLIEAKGYSVNAAAEFIHKDSDGKVTQGRARQVWNNRMGCTCVQVDKPLKKQTKPEVKKQLDEFVSAVKKDEVTDDDAKKVMDVVADKITNGTFAKRVGTKVATAIKKVNKSTKEVELREPDNYQRLLKNVSGTTSGLQALIDGEIPEPETETEREAAVCIKAALPNLCLLIARLGINLIEINDIFFKGEQNERQHTNGQIEYRSN